MWPHRENGMSSTTASDPSTLPEGPLTTDGIWDALLAPYVLAEGQAIAWKLGPLWLQATRRAREWSLEWRHESVPLIPDLEVIGPGEPISDEEAATARFGFGESPAQVRLAPRLSDRPVVVRPEKPFSVLAGEEVSIYVSTPVWAVINVGEPPQELMEEPSFRPSDTWFGPTTMDGELCYASRSEARLVLDNLDETLSRAVTPIRIQNRSDGLLEVARLNVPIPHLALYGHLGNRLWTQELTVVHRSGTSMDDVRINEQMPAELESAKRIVDARDHTPGSLLFRVFGKLRM